ncbi:hypothetical protein ACIQVK_44340 [Streptomyces sp. NPDC090493]|uniref:hypothetical protein n=1 Tax=Streptomyces sp. NPDC090493 TaxID=3365964 RepID=UPI0037FB6B84
MIQSAHDRKIRQALAAVSIPTPLTVDTLFAVMQERYQLRYGRLLELLRGPCPIPGLNANALWFQRGDEGPDGVWVADALTGAAAVHNLGHEWGHQEMGHKPLLLPVKPKPEPYQFLSPDFLGGCLFGRARSHEGPQDPEYVRIENEAEGFAYLLRRKAAEHARDSRHHDPLVDRLHHSL